VALPDVADMARVERPQAAGPEIGGNRVTILSRHSPPSNYVKDKKRHDHRKQRH
jgi:hypothetical protein